uniref:Uncharacterized protein n=1 Tax=Panagrolaimus sp. JU765 TaxID=591449 RepID=A0AC34Q124_9BILA
MQAYVASFKEANKARIDAKVRLQMMQNAMEARDSPNKNVQENESLKVSLAVPAAVVSTESKENVDAVSEVDPPSAGKDAI